MARKLFDRIVRKRPNKKLRKLTLKKILIYPFILIGKFFCLLLRLCLNQKRRDALAYNFICILGYDRVDWRIEDHYSNNNPNVKIRVTKIMLVD
jgi:hypothetical protein